MREFSFSDPPHFITLFSLTLPCFSLGTPPLFATLLTLSALSLDRRRQRSPASHCQTRHLPRQLEREGLRPQEEQMVCLSLPFFCPVPSVSSTPILTPLLLLRLAKIKGWIDEHNPGDPLIPFSVALEERLVNMSEEEKKEEETKIGAISALPKITKAGYDSLDVRSFLLFLRLYMLIGMWLYVL